MDSAVAPHEFKSIGYVLEFDDNGDVKPKAELPDYTVFAYDDTDDSDPVRVNSVLQNSEARMTVSIQKLFRQALNTTTTKR